MGFAKQIVGYWDVLYKIPMTKLKKIEIPLAPIYMCKCIKCGMKARVPSKHLKRVQSVCPKCGASPRARKRRYKGSAIHTYWQNLVARYRTRPYLYDPSWSTFRGFLLQMGKEFDNLSMSNPDKRITLIRRDRNKPFSKENCMWVCRPCMSNTMPVDILEALEKDIALLTENCELEGEEKPPTKKVPKSY